MLWKCSVCILNVNSLDTLLNDVRCVLVSNLARHTNYSVPTARLSACSGCIDSYGSKNLFSRFFIVHATGYESILLNSCLLLLPSVWGITLNWSFYLIYFIEIARSVKCCCRICLANDRDIRNLLLFIDKLCDVYNKWFVLDFLQYWCSVSARLNMFSIN